MPRRSRRLSADLRSAFFLPLLLATAPIRAGAAVDGRLDRFVVPTAESIALDLDPEKTDYAGRVDIELRINASVDTFMLNALDLTIETAELSDAAGPVPLEWAPDERGRLTVRASRRLDPGSGRLSFTFRNDFDTSGNALYRYEEGGRYYLASQFEAIAAREAFPCWDEPEFKIPWRITVTAPPGDLVVSNTPVAAESTVNGVRTIRFKPTPPLPSYLVAIVAGPYVTVPIEGLRFPARIVSVPDRDGLAREAARITPGIVAGLEDYFGTPFPFEKLDLIALPEYQGGAMENAAAITFSEDLLLVDPANTTPAARRFMVTTLVHEIAHMWFGDLVTMEWWDDLWLNESFAEWMANRLTDRLFPEFNLDVVTREFGEKAMNSDARPSARAVRGTVNAFDNIDQLFDAFSYEKGGVILAMLENWIGEDAFREGVRLYLKEYAWRNATAPDLWRCLGRAAGRPIDAVARSFLEQPGVPLVTASFLPDGRLRLSQRRFTPAGGDPGSSVWAVPLTLRFPGDGRMESRRVLLASPDTVMSLDLREPPLWIHPNGGAIGYCRWAVSPESLDRMAESEALTPRERLGFLLNARALLTAGDLDGGRYLDFLQSAAGDREPAVVRAVVDGLGDIRETFSDPRLSEGLSAFTRAALRPALARIGLAPEPGEPESVTLLRPDLITMLGDLGDDIPVRDRVEPAALAWLEGGAGLDPTVLGAGLSLVASRGDSATMTLILDRFRAETDPTDRRRLLEALAGFRGEPLVRRLLDVSLTFRRPAEMHQLARYLVRQPGNGDVVFTWLETHWTPFAQRLPEYLVAELPELAARCAEERLPEIEAFFADAPHRVPGTAMALEEAADRIRQRASLRKREGGAVAARLSRDAAGSQ